ncbi:hypothetical protein [Marinicrinis sediminis]|uniref:DUF4268 domain-containing protein n=1 Tax=Marinicrinis sediminis TaxID=1652465 RepID=A0ABW5RB24_9BACL
MKEAKLTIWKPHNDIPQKLLDLHNIIWNENGLQIELMDNKETHVTIIFEQFVISHRVTRERLMLKYQDMYGKFREKNDSWSLFKMNGDDYDKWFRAQHYDLYADMHKKIEHFVIVTEDEIIEILNDYEPTITMKTL